MTINVPRELLADLLGNDHDKRIMAERHLLAMLANAPSPAGVDGLEVVGWYRMDDRKAITPYPSVCATWHKMGVKVGAAYSDSAHAIIDGLRGEVERLQMQLAACGVVALANTIESAGEARQMHPDYMSASCSDVADAVDREIALRTQRDQQAQRIGELAELAAQASVNCKNTAYYLRKYRPDLADICSGWCVAIDAALSAGKENQDEHN